MSSIPPEENGPPVGNELFREHTQYTTQMKDMASRVSTIDVKADNALDNEYSSNRLFVSNFPFSWGERELRNFMKDFEPVAEVEIVYNERGSKGFGFVTINDPDRCMRARMFLNHKIVNGRRVEVRRAHRHKKAANVKTNFQQQQMQNLNALLQQTAALHAVLLQPGLLNLLQQQLTASNSLIGQQQLATSSLNISQGVPSSHGFVNSAPPTHLAPPRNEIDRRMSLLSNNQAHLSTQIGMHNNFAPGSSSSSETSHSPSPLHHIHEDPSNGFNHGVFLAKAPGSKLERDQNKINQTYRPASDRSTSMLNLWIPQ